MLEEVAGGDHAGDYEGAAVEGVISSSLCPGSRDVELFAQTLRPYLVPSPSND